MDLTDEEWKKKLTSTQYHILREKGTETPFSGKLLNQNGNGDFVCAACGTVLFKSDAKYDSHIPGLEGWPSFADAANNDAIVLSDDSSFGMHRTEVSCKNCGGHLGHLFDDDGSPSGKHFCINSEALEFKDK